MGGNVSKLSKRNKTSGTAALLREAWNVSALPAAVPPEHGWRELLHIVFIILRERSLQESSINPMCCVKVTRDGQGLLETVHGLCQTTCHAHLGLSGGSQRSFPRPRRALHIELTPEEENSIGCFPPIPIFLKFRLYCGCLAPEGYTDSHPSPRPCYSTGITGRPLSQVRPSALPLFGRAITL